MFFPGYKPFICSVWEKQFGDEVDVYEDLHMLRIDNYKGWEMTLRRRREVAGDHTHPLVSLTRIRAAKGWK